MTEQESTACALLMSSNNSEIGRVSGEIVLFRYYTMMPTTTNVLPKGGKWFKSQIYFDGGCQLLVARLVTTPVVSSQES